MIVSRRPYQVIPRPNRHVGELVCTPLACRLSAKRAKVLVAWIHVHQYAGVAFEILYQQKLDGFGLGMPAIHGKVFGQNQVQVHVDQVTCLPCSQLMDVDPLMPAVPL